ncbi:MAG TPA: acetylornithine deacetylase [Terriglobales bacterium]|jgi:acetylornithine deacetylase|nr:acetylornithine deacetylase [Terriglobales bacterium]
MKTVVEHLSNLIRIPSPSFLSNRPIIDYAVNALREAQWHSREIIYRDAAGVEKVNLIAAPPEQDLDNITAELALMCHTDTVPYSIDWPQALEPHIADGLLHGCGACDVKGFLACLLTSIAESDSSKLIDGLRLILTADEEIGCVGAAHLVMSRLIKPRRVVIGEPTSLHPARAGKGYCLAEVTVFGEEAHSALPHKGRSAIYRAARLVTAIEEYGSLLAEEQHPLFSPDFTTLNIGTIQGGTAKNIIAGQCKFQLEWRPIPGQAEGTVPSAVSRMADSLRGADPNFRYELQTLRHQTGFETAASSKLVRSIEAITGRAATSIPFGSEASLLAPMAEEVVVFGPGDMQTAHSNRECVALNELDEAVECLQSLMTNR